MPSEQVSATGSSQSWAYQLPAFTSAGYRVIAFDRRGRGRTEVVPESGPQPGSGADLYSTCLAIENLWLAARAEGLGVGRMSIAEPECLQRIFELPE